MIKNVLCKFWSWRSLARQKQVDEERGEDALNRVMGLFDLTALGVGSTLGLGVYVLAGRVAREAAGPGVCISFLIAAIASAFAGLCYAEFAARVPRAGSAYAYSYVTVGEFIAFVIGWNLILEYAIGTASVARGLSNYIDTLAYKAIGNVLKEYMPMNVDFLSEYPDFFAFAMIFLLTILLCVGAKESSLLNNVFVGINMITILIIIIAGSLEANPANWTIDASNITGNLPADAVVGKGGFMPFGFSGVMAGAATCFYGFIGFDTVATTGEEAKNPQKDIPLAIVLSLSIIFVAYFSISTVLTMMLPYYAQDVEAPFPFVFGQLGWTTIRWIVNIGAIFALFTSLIGGMYPLPRIFYAMGNDGVLFKFLAKINSRTKTPLIGTIIAGLLIGVMTLMFNLQQLVDMMSIGTLLAYTIVAISVLILRYRVQNNKLKKAKKMARKVSKTGFWIFFMKLFNLNNLKEPSNFSSNVAKYGVIVFCIITFIIGSLLGHIDFTSSENYITPIVFLSIFGLMLILTVSAIGRQPCQKEQLTFKVPLVPLIPCLSIFINLYLMLQLDRNTWIRFSVWMLVGFCIYFIYGIRNSSQGKRDALQKENERKNKTEKKNENEEEMNTEKKNEIEKKNGAEKKTDVEKKIRNENKVEQKNGVEKKTGVEKKNETIS